MAVEGTETFALQSHEWLFILIYSICTTFFRNFPSAHFNRVWKGFCVIRDLAEIECVIRECKINPAVIRENYIGCDAGFA